MPNTVYGPYAAHNWIAGDAANATRLNNLESQAADALHGINPDIIGAGFVLSGVTCTKDGTIANQLDIASGRAYVLLSDGTVGLIVVGADNTHTTVTANTTYHLYLQPDGTWYWSTSNAPAANSLAICNVTTDASGNISTVTDARMLNPTLFPGAAGMPSFNTLNAAHLSFAYGSQFGTYSATVMAPDAGARPAGTVVGQIVTVWTGSALANVLAIGSTDSRNAPTMLSPTGALNQVANQATVGSYGVPLIIAQAVMVPVSSTTQQTILSITTPSVNGLYRMSGTLSKLNTTSNLLYMQVAYTDPFTGAGTGAYFQVQGLNASYWVLSAGTGDTSIGATSLPLLPVVFHAKASTNISVLYQDPSGTPNDTVSVVLERLA